MSSPLRVGQTTQAAGAAALSNGQSQAVTTGWKSDVPSVATVSDGGLVTGVANGRANIYVISGGQQGLAQVRVTPDYHGRWSGRLLVTACAQAGAWATLNFCRDFPNGSSDPFASSFTQSGELLSALANYGDTVFPAVSASLAPDGSASFVTTFVSATSPVITIEANWTINSSRAGELTGTVTELWRAPGVPGEARLVQDIVGAVRTNAVPLTTTDGDTSSKSLAFSRIATSR